MRDALGVSFYLAVVPVDVPVLGAKAVSWLRRLKELAGSLFRVFDDYDSFGSASYTRSSAGLLEPTCSDLHSRPGI